MADTAEELLRTIGTIYRRWLAGTLSQEDALFEIGDLLTQTSEAKEPLSPPAGGAEPRG